MDYVLKPSLKHIALTKIAVALWDRDAMYLMAKYLLSRHFERALKAGDEVIKKVPELLLPQSLEKKLLKFVSAIGREILKWRVHHYLKFNLVIKLPSELCWTPHGTVDTRKTAEVFIQNENIDVTSRYKLACDYCLEDDIPKLWNKIPENLREELYRNIEQENLVSFWTYGIKGEVDRLERTWGRSERSRYRRAFKCAASHGNKAATEYFLQRQIHEKREESLVASARLAVNKGTLPSYFPDVLCFLFSQMHERKQVEVSKDDAYGVLRHLLEWPWQSLFMEMANRMWDFLPKFEFRLLLGVMFGMVNTARDWDYLKLYVEFWLQSPNTHKKYVIDECKAGRLFLLSVLYAMEDRELRLFLNSVTAEERDVIFSPRRNMEFFQRVVDDEEWDSLKTFLQGCLSSKEVMIEFKKKFNEHIVHKLKNVKQKRKYAAKKYKWDKFFQLLDDLIQETNNKRSAEETGESTSAKKLRGTEF